MSKSPELFLLKVGDSYYRTTPNGRYGRFDSSKETAMPMCSDCRNIMDKSLTHIDVKHEFEFYDTAEQCPNCHIYLVEPMTIEQKIGVDMLIQAERSRLGKDDDPWKVWEQNKIKGKP